jgi:hypothetical protein
MFFTLVNVEFTRRGFPQSVSCGASIVFPGFHPGWSAAAKSDAVIGVNDPLQLEPAEVSFAMDATSVATIVSLLVVYMAIFFRPLKKSFFDLVMTLRL